MNEWNTFSFTFTIELKTWHWIVGIKETQTNKKSNKPKVTNIHTTALPFCFVLFWLEIYSCKILLLFYSVTCILSAGCRLCFKIYRYFIVLCLANNNIKHCVNLRKKEMPIKYWRLSIRLFVFCCQLSFFLEVVILFVCRRKEKDWILSIVDK